MATFRYEGFFSSGKKAKGLISGDDSVDVKQKLSQRGLFLSKLTEVPTKKRIKALSKKEVLLFTKELSKLIHAGLPLFEALAALEEKYRGHASHPLLIDLCDKVKHGYSFSSALKSHEESFDVLYLCMVEHAERTGNLVGALEEISQFTSRYLELKKKLVGALLYPGILSAFCFGVLGMLLFYVIPSLADLFEGRSLHPFTSFILGVSKTANAHKSGILFGGAFFLVSVWLAFRSSFGKKKLLSLCLRFPFVGHILDKTALVRFCRSSSALLQAGVPFLETVGLAKKVMKHPPLENVFEEAEKHLLSGGKVSESLQKSPLIPSLFVRMLALAEVGGNLPLMMKHLSQIYEEELEKHFSQMTQMAQPILLLFIGAVIGLVLLSVLLPLTDVGSFLENS